MTRREFIKAAAAAAALAPFARLGAQTEGASGAAAAGASGTAAPDARKLTRRMVGDVSVPLLGYGCMRLPTEGDHVDLKATERLWSRYIEGGGNYFDTAYMYHGGESEKAIGEILSKRPRDSYLLTDKMPVWMARTEAGLRRVFDDQLARTKAEYFDFYFLHALGKGNWETARKIHALEFLLERKKEGRIRHLGFSFHDSPEELTPILDAYDWDLTMIQLNYMDWTKYRSREQYEQLEKRGIPVAVMEPLHGGALAKPNEAAAAILRQANPNASPASWAFRWVASLPGVSLINSGMTHESDLEDNLATFSPFRPLDESERDTLAAALVAILQDQAIPCTGCRYCLPCPVGVEIPTIFDYYNQYKAGGDERRFLRRYESLAEESRASECVRCKRCMQHCPQKIAIPDELAKIDAEYRRLKG